MSDGTGRGTVLLLTVGVLTLGSNAFILSPILSEVAADLGSRPQAVARAISAFGAATAVSAFFLAGRADRWGARTTLAGAMLVLASAVALAALARSWLMLAGAQAMAGLASGVILPATYATATITAPKGREAQRLGTVLSGWALSLVAGVPLSALVSDHFGWRAAYGGLAAIAAVLAVCLAMALPRVTRAADAPAPVAPVTLLPRRGVMPVLIACFLAMCAFYASFSFFGEGLRTALGVGPSGAGIYVLSYGLGFGAAGLFANISARVGPTRTLPVALGAVAIAYALLPLALTHKATALAAAAIWGFTNQFGLNALVLSLVGRVPEARASVLGLHSTVTYMALFVGPLLAGWLMTHGGYGYVALLSAGLAALGVVAAWPRRA